MRATSEHAQESATRLKTPTHNPIAGLAGAVAAVAGMAACCLTALAVNPLPVGVNDYDDAGANIFLDGEITSIHVTMDPADLQDCLDDPFSNEYKVCSIRVVNSRIDETVSDVGIRPRGNTSRQSIKKSWKLKFNEFVPDRKFHGLEKFNVNGEHNDISIVRSKLAWDLFKEMGVPSPRAHHVHFTINDGAYVEGMHINVEPIDDELVDAWYGNNHGNLYKCLYKHVRADLRYVPPGTPETYQGLGGGLVYQEEINEDNPDYTDLADFIDFINHTDDSTFAAEIMDRFSVDNFLRAMAVDVTIGQWDNYWYGANNYYLYHNEVTNRFEFIPYDYDNTYGIDFFGIDWASRSYATWGNGGYGSDGGQLPPLIERILDIPAYEAQYRRYLRELVGAVGDPDISSTTYTDTVDDVFAGLGPHYDVVSVEVGNDANMLYITIEVNGPVDVGGDTGNGVYLIFFDSKPGGSPSNPWGRAIDATVPHDFFIGSWPDGGGGAQLWEYGSDWYQPGSGLSIDLSDKTNGRIGYSVPLDDLDVGVGDSFDFDVAATGGSSGDPGLDHLSNPSMSTPDWGTPSTPGAYLIYTVQEATPPPSVDGPFTLAETEAGIDAIATMVEPFAWAGSYAPPNNDYPWMFNNANFSVSFTSPASFTAGQNPWGWGIKPYIEARTNSLRSTVPEPPELPELRVNEMLAYNCDINTDGFGEYDDWVEIYNAGSVPADVSGMYLTDDPGVPTEWQFPAGTTIAAGEFLLVWCDDQPGQGPLHATFKLALAGEGVGLFHDDSNGNVLIDYVAYPPLEGNVSYGRYPDGDDAVATFTTVTPAAANDDSGGPPPDPGPVPAIYVNEWMADNNVTIADELGEYEDWIELYNAEDVAVDLGGMHLTDDLDDRTKWRIPDGTSIGAGGYLLIWADDEELDGPLHASFKLSKDGEEIGLYDARSNCLAEVNIVAFGSQAADLSEGRYADGTACITFLRLPTPGVTNMSLPGDFDDDGDVDVTDFDDFAACLAGPGQPPAPTCAPCVDADLDGDADVDLDDFAVFAATFGDEGAH